MVTFETYQPTQIDGWMSNEELQWLYKQAKLCRTIVEVGSWCGRSTHALLSGCPDGGVVYAVDTWKGSPSELERDHKRALTCDIYKEFLENVGHFPNLIPLRMDSVEAAENFPPNYFDLVFIDADHTKDAVVKDLKAWGSKAKVLCGHDIGYVSIVDALVECGIKIDRAVGCIWVRKAVL